MTRRPNLPGYVESVPGSAATDGPALRAALIAAGVIRPRVDAPPAVTLAGPCLRLEGGPTWSWDELQGHQKLVHEAKRRRSDKSEDT